MSKNNILILTLCIIILLTSAYFFYLSRTIDSYYAVYLKTGDLYFGHLSIFPALTMTDIHYIKQNQTDNSLELQKFTASIFSPEDKFTLSRDNIVWIAKLSNDSQVIKAIKQGVTTTTTTTTKDQTQTKDNNQAK